MEKILIDRAFDLAKQKTANSMLNEIYHWMFKNGHYFSDEKPTHLMPLPDQPK